jgi:hypothetical protein
MTVLPSLTRFGRHGWLAPPSASAYDTAIAALSPSAYWKFDEPPGATTFADSSGNGHTLTGSGKYSAGVPGIVPNNSDKSALFLSGAGHAELASSSDFDFTSLGAFSFVITFGMKRSPGTAFLYTKSDTSGFGHYFMWYPSTFAFALWQNGSVYRTYRASYDPAILANGPGLHHLVVSWDGNLSHSATMWLDGTALTVSSDSSGTPTTLTNTGKFRVSGRADGYEWTGSVQDFAFFVGTAINSTQAGNLWTAFQTARSAAPTPVIFDTDGGNGDVGDVIAGAGLIHAHLAGHINLLGVCVTTGDIYTAPAWRKILDYYGLTSIPVGAYQGIDCHVGGGSGTPARTIRDTFRPTDDRTNYSDPTTFYNSLLTGAGNASVVVVAIGPANSVAQFINSSTAHKTLWNQKVKSFYFAAGQWPNSSSSASPPGNYNASGVGEWNVGGSDASSVGVAEAQAAIDIVANSTAKHYWIGIEICGNTGNNPALGDFIASQVPNQWPTTNPIGLAAAGTNRTAWDSNALRVALNYEIYGASNNFFTANQINAPTFSTTAATAGQNASSSGSSNNWYITPKLGPYTISEWRAAMTGMLNERIPRP